MSNTFCQPYLLEQFAQKNYIRQICALFVSFSSVFIILFGMCLLVYYDHALYVHGHVRVYIRSMAVRLLHYYKLGFYFCLFKPKFICNQNFRFQTMDYQKQDKQKKNHLSISVNQNQKINSIINYQQLYQYELNLRVSLQKQLQIEKIKVKKLLRGKAKGKLCPKCLNDMNESTELEQNLVQNFKQFSSKMSSMITKKTLQLQKVDSFLSPASNMISAAESVPIIENFTVFGLSQANILQTGMRNFEQVGGQILYSLKQVSQLQKQAANFIFPSGVAIKRIRGSKAKDKAIQIMSFCYTNIKSFILGFKSPNMKFPSQYYEKNDLLNYVNKQRNLFFICIGVRDYTWIQNSDKNIIISMDLIQQGIFSSQFNPSDNHIRSEGTKMNDMTFGTSLKSIDQTWQEIALSQRVFCISSYFPFFTFFQQILRSLINNIKMERLHLYKLNSEDMQQTIKQTDSKYQLERISQLFISTISEICNKKMQFNRSYEIKLINQQKVTLLTDWNYAKTYFIDEWIFTILNMFTVDTLLDLWTQIILEQGKGVVFVCQNSHILTYTVYLFGNILVKPFSYAYPIVNIVPEDQDFLDSPFPVIYGMFKKRKYVEQNQLVQRYNDRTYVFLNPQKVDIIYSAESKKNVQKRKPNKLKNDLTVLFRDLKNYRRKQTKTTKYEIQTTDYSFLSKLQERQKSVEIVAKINEYIQKQVVQKIPTKIQIQQINQKIDASQIPPQKTPQTYLISKVVNSIKKSSKDPFLERFLQTQIFSNYLLEQEEAE